jgi:hypothetical protein
MDGMVDDGYDSLFPTTTEVDHDVVSRTVCMRYMSMNGNVILIILPYAGSKWSDDTTLHGLT